MYHTGPSKSTTLIIVMVGILLLSSCCSSIIYIIRNNRKTTSETKANAIGNEAPAPIQYPDQNSQPIQDVSSQAQNNNTNTTTETDTSLNNKNTNVHTLDVNNQMTMSQGGSLLFNLPHGKIKLNLI